MNKYEVTITETLERKIEVEAESAEEAQRMVTDGWENSDYILLKLLSELILKSQNRIKKNSILPRVRKISF